jgi:enterochelin esterase-like enzyme
MSNNGMAGNLIVETFDYDDGRQVTVYVPTDTPNSVVYAADGDWHTSRLAEALEAADARTTMVVGVHGTGDDDGRFHEYVPVVDPERFSAYERFFLEDVGGWVRSHFGLTPSPDRTAVWGASLGGEFALAMGVRHPDVYGTVFCASPGGGYKPSGEMPRPLPRAYLVGGTEEPFFLENAMRWADALRDAGADVLMAERSGDHGGAFWMEEFPLMVSWAFGR